MCGCLDALVAKQIVASERVQEGKQMLLRIVSMLCGLIERFDTPGQLREEPVEYRVEDQEKCEARTRTRTRTKN